MNSDYKSQLKSLENSFSPALDNFHNTYIVHYTNQDSSEYTQIYSQAKGQITGINTSLFTLKNSIQGNIDLLNKKISTLDTQIQKEKDENTILQKKWTEKRGKSLSSEELILESRDAYNYQTVKNVTLLLGDIVLLYFIFQMV